MTPSVQNEEVILEKIRQNCSDVTSVSPRRIPQGLSLQQLGQALEYNTHVTHLDLRIYTPRRGENLKQLLFFIETSRSLETLICGGIPHVTQIVLHSLARRTLPLERLEIQLSSVNLWNLFRTYLITLPEIAFLHVHFPHDTNNLVVDAEMFRAAATAKFQSIRVNNVCPLALFEGFEQNPTTKRLHIQVTGDMLDATTVERTCQLLRRRESASVQVHLDLEMFEDWDTEVWLAFFEHSSAFPDKVIAFISFHSCNMDDNACAEIMPKLLACTTRKVQFGGQILLSQAVMDAVILNAVEIDCGSSLSMKQTRLILHRIVQVKGKVCSLNLGSNHSLEIILDDLVNFLPRLSLNSLSFGFQVGQKTIPTIVNDCKRRILRSLWRNQNLIERIHIDAPCIDEHDDEFLRHILLRNGHLPDLLEPTRLVQLDESLLPHFFKQLAQLDPSALHRSLIALHGTGSQHGRFI